MVIVKEISYQDFLNSKFENPKNNDNLEDPKDTTVLSVKIAENSSGGTYLFKWL